MSVSPKRWLEVWVGPDDAADRLLVLRSADAGAVDVADPQDGWHPLHRFESYDAATRWLRQESYERGGSRCALP